MSDPGAGPPPVGPTGPPLGGGPPPVAGFTTVAQLLPKIEQILSKMFEQVGVMQGGGYAVHAGSTDVFVTAGQLNENHTVVEVFAFTNLEIDPTPDFYKWFALNSDIAPFGALKLAGRENGQVDVMIAHRLLGTYIDLPELQGALFYITQTADAIDEQVKEMFGGRTFRETSEEAKPAPGKSDAGYL